MRRQAPPPSLSSLLDARTPRGLAIPPSPSYSSNNPPYSPSVYSRAGTSFDYDPGPYGDEDSDKPAFAQLREAWKELHGNPDEGDRDSKADVREPAMEKTQGADEDGATSRLSVMGPKMKLLSKAPWEDGPTGGDIMEEAEDDISDTASIFGRKKSRERSRTVTNKASDESSKGWMTFSRNHRPGRDGSTMKDMISGPLSSTSSSSDYDTPSSPIQYHHPSSPIHPRQRTASSNTSQTRSESLVSSYTTASSWSSGVPPAGPSPRSDRFPSSTPVSPNHSNFKTTSQQPQQPPPPRSESSDSPTPKSSEEMVHPYANPEVYSSLSSATPYPKSPNRAEFLAADLHPSAVRGGAAFARSESVNTITSNSTATVVAPSSSTLSSVAFPVSPSLGATTSGTAGSSSSASMMRKDSSNLSGMHAYPGSPAYNLISLEQAQEKIRGRSKSGGGPSPIKSYSTYSQDAFGSEPLSTRKMSMPGGSVSPYSSSSSLATQAAPPLPDRSLGRGLPAEHGDSPPLPAIPSSQSTTPTQVQPPPAGGKTLKPKRSGFLRMLRNNDRDKSKERGAAMNEGFEVVSTRSISSMAEIGLGIGGVNTSNSGAESGSRPPVPSVPVQYRQEHKTLAQMQAQAQSQNTSATSNVSLTGSLSSSLRGRGSVPSIIAHSPSLTSVSEQKPSKTSLRKRSAPTLELPSPAAGEQREVPSLQLRPVSSLFSSGLPLDLMTPSSPSPSENATTLDNEKSRDPSGGLGMRRRPIDLGIGIPSKNFNLGDLAGAGGDLYSPMTASSLSSGFSRSTATSASTGPPATPSSSRSHILSPSSSPTSFGGSTTPTAGSGSGSASQSQQNQNQALRAQVQILQDTLLQERRARQLQNWEYEGQIRDLTEELEKVRAAPCGECGAALRVRAREDAMKGQGQGRMLDRPRTKSANGRPVGV